MTRTDQLARTIFALLVFACFAAFFVTQRLKHSPTAVQSFKMTPSFSPTRAGPASAGLPGEAAISFHLAQTDEVTVTVVDSSLNTWATLVRNWPVVRYKQFSLRWNGRIGIARGYTLAREPSRVVPGGRTIVKPANVGRVAPAGEYRIRVSLRRQHRSVLSPRILTLVR